MAAAVIGFGAAGVATAAPKASATLASEGKGVRVTVAVVGTPLPTRVSARAGRVTVRLSGRGAAWRSSVLTGRKAVAFRARVGKTIGVTMTAGGRTIRASARLAAAGTSGGSGGAAGGGASGGAAGDGPPFSPPGTRLVGMDAVNAIQKYLVNATFTNCVAGYPLCAVETRYGFFPDATMYYCRLTPTAGADIINAPAPFQITGAEQNPDGEWGVSMAVTSYGNLTHYLWDVRPDGSVTGRYWGPGRDPATDAASEEISGLTWVRGGRTCAY